MNDGPSNAAAAVFTTNRCKANPVLWSEQVVSDGRVKAVILNSGGANCYTGSQGFQTPIARRSGWPNCSMRTVTDIAVCSTGLIGDQLDVDRP